MHVHFVDVVLPGDSKNIPYCVKQAAPHVLCGACLNAVLKRLVHASTHAVVGMGCVGLVGRRSLCSE